MKMIKTNIYSDPLNGCMEKTVKSNISSKF